MTKKKKRRIGNYELLGKIERNWPQFNVCVALQVGLDRQVELRVLRATLDIKSPLLHRFQREYKTLARLDHPRIMKILDVGFGSGRAFYVTELRNSQSLGDELRQLGRPFSTDKIIQVAQEIAEALKYLHGQKILHRNLGMETIFCDNTNDFFYIAEFSLGKDLTKKSLTEQGYPQLAPMQFTSEILCNGQVTERTDLYLLGMVLHALASGKICQPRLTKKLGEDSGVFKIESPRERNRNLPAALEKLILRLVAHDPFDRPDSAKSFLEELELCKLRCATRAIVIEQRNKDFVATHKETADHSREHLNRHKTVTEENQAWAISDFRDSFNELGKAYKAALLLFLIPPLFLAIYFIQPEAEVDYANEPAFERPSVLDRISGSISGKQTEIRALDLNDRILRLKGKTDKQDFNRRWMLLLAWRRSFPRNEQEQWLRYDKLLNARLAFANDKNRGCYHLDRILKLVQRNAKTLAKVKSS